MRENKSIISVNNVSMVFNLASEKVDSLKEYVLKLVKRQLMMQPFQALTDVNLGILAHTLDDEHIEPVPHQFSVILVNDTVLTQKGFNGVRLDHFNRRDILFFLHNGRGRCGNFGGLDLLFSAAAQEKGR